MKVYISTNCLYNLGFNKTLSLYNKCSIVNIELSSYPDIIKPTDVYKTISNYPANYLVHNYFPPPSKSFVFNLASLNPEVSQKSLDLAKKAVKLCRKIKSPFYSFHGGFLYDAVGKLEQKTKTLKLINSQIYDRKRALRRFFENIVVLKKIADKNNIELLVENNVCPPRLKNKLLFYDHKDFLWLFSQKETKDIGVLLDTGHLKVSATTYNFPINKVIKSLGNKIKAFHLHDNNGRADLNRKIKPGSWIEKLIIKMKKRNPVFILEVYCKNISEVLEQKKYLECL